MGMFRLESLLLAKTALWLEQEKKKNFSGFCLKTKLLLDDFRNSKKMGLVQKC